MNLYRRLGAATVRNLLFLFAAGLLFWSSLASLLPTMSLYLQHVGARDQQVGWIMGSFAVGLLVFRPWLGRMADYRGRWIVLIIGLIVAAIAPLLYLTTQSIPLLLCIRVFHGLSVAAFTTASSALVVDFSPPENRGELIGYMSLANPVGMAIGPALGSFILDEWGYTALFRLSGSLGGMALLSGLAVRAPVLPAQSADDRPPQPFWKMVWDARLRIPTLVMLMVGMAFGTLSTFLPLMIKAEQIPFRAGWFYTAAAIASFTVRVVTGKASDRFGRGRFITVSILCYSLSMVILMHATTPAAFILAGVIEGMGGGIFIPMMVALVADRSAAYERGRVFSICIAGFDLGIAIAGPTFGYFAETVGYRQLFFLAASLTLMGCAAFILFGSKNLRCSLRYALGNGRDVYSVATK